MLAAAVLVFREVLEAALVVSVVMASTRGVWGRGRWVSGGIGLGLSGAIVVALFAGRIADAAQGMGQELLNASVLLLAVAMLAWHAIWMARHGRALATQMHGLGAAVREGSRSLAALLLVVALAVLREGSEVVLFLFGMGAGGAGATALGGGTMLGLVAGIAAGAALYAGLLRIPMRHLFGVTNWMIVLLAAGMASHAAHYLIQADWLPALGTALWDSSAWLSDHSLLGQTLGTLVGYDARPAGMQLIFYVVTALSIGIGMKTWGSTDLRP